METATATAPRWMGVVLLLAGVYNLAWGASVVLLPAWSYHVGGLERDGVALPDSFAPLWQCIGMIVGVYGVGYLCAARAPVRHWPVVLVGFLGKLFGPIGAVKAVYVDHTLPQGMLLTNTFNDLIWLLPFGMILWRAWVGRPVVSRTPLEEQALGPGFLPRSAD